MAGLGQRRALQAADVGRGVVVDPGGDVPRILAGLDRAGFEESFVRLATLRRRLDAGELDDGLRPVPFDS